MLKFNLRDFAGGIIVSLVGLLFVIGAFHMRLGTAVQMGPGYFPAVVGTLVIVLGLIVAGLSFFSERSDIEVHWRQAIAILLSIAAFAFALDQVGLMPAMVVGVAIAAYGDPTSRPIPTLLLGLGSAIGAWAIFILGLGLQMSALKLPEWLG